MVLGRRVGSVGRVGSIGASIELMPSPICFAHRGASAVEPDNTLQAFELALRLGATGLETDAWLTADGAIVFDHDGQVGQKFRRRPISTVERAQLPEHIPTMDELFAACGADFHLSIDVCDAAAFEPIIAAAQSRLGLDRLWLCHRSMDVLGSVAEVHPSVRLVHSTSVGEMSSTPERHGAELRSRRLTGVNLRHEQWSAGRCALFARFGILSFAWGLEHTRQMQDVLAMGVHGMYSDHVDRMVEVVGAPR
jgi:glycerophosphoryl diester phosphodiesterase